MFGCWQQRCWLLRLKAALSQLLCLVGGYSGVAHCMQLRLQRAASACQDGRSGSAQACASGWAGAGAPSAGAEPSATPGGSTPGKPGGIMKGAPAAPGCAAYSSGSCPS